MTYSPLAVSVSELRYRRLFEAAQDGILILDASSAKIIDANPFIAELLGYALSELLGMQLWQLGLFEDQQANLLATQQLQQQHYIRYDDLPLKTKAGRCINVEFVSNVYCEGKQQVIQCNIRDISERKRIAAELKDSLARLKNADQRKNEFLAMLAHELRNPLAPIRNAVQVLLLNGDPTVRPMAEMMERQVGQVVRLVDDLLDLSRVSRGKIELRKERVELALVVQQTVEAARALVQCMQHNIRVSLPSEPIYLEADPTRLAQIIGNLLNNACKFTAQGGQLSLLVERDGAQAVIRVRDSGIGIALELLPQLFDLFMQVDSSLERVVSGLGIGLTLVKNLVELHGGTVQAFSAGIGLGSEFVVRLPMLVEVAPTQALQDLSPASRPLTRRILVVDDNRDAATSLAMVLRLTGYEVEIAYDGLEAVTLAESFAPDVLLLDIGLPKLNGYQVARHIRAQTWGQRIVLFALTGWGQEEDRQQSKAAGFAMHLVKPVDIELLMKLLSQPLAEHAS